MSKEVKFSLVFRDMWQSAGKYQPRVDQLLKVAPAIIKMGCFDRVETNGGGFEQVNLLYGENPNKSVREWTKPFHEAGIQTHMLDRALNALRMSPCPKDLRQLFYKVSVHIHTLVHNDKSARVVPLDHAADPVHLVLADHDEQHLPFLVGECALRMNPGNTAVQLAHDLYFHGRGILQAGDHQDLGVDILRVHPVAGKGTEEGIYNTVDHGLDIKQEKVDCIKAEVHVHAQLAHRGLPAEGNDDHTYQIEAAVRRAHAQDHTDAGSADKSCDDGVSEKVRKNRFRRDRNHGHCHGDGGNGKDGFIEKTAPHLLICVSQGRRIQDPVQNSCNVRVLRDNVHIVL